MVTFKKKPTEYIGDFPLRCPKCIPPHRYCVCGKFPVVTSPIPVTILIQWSELWYVSNSGSWIHQTLSPSELLVRGAMSDRRFLEHTPRDGEMALLIFPGPDVEKCSQPGIDSTIAFVSKYSHPGETFYP